METKCGLSIGQRLFIEGIPLLQTGQILPPLYLSLSKKLEPVLSNIEQLGYDCFRSVFGPVEEFTDRQLVVFEEPSESIWIVASRARSGNKLAADVKKILSLLRELDELVREQDGVAVTEVLLSQTAK